MEDNMMTKENKVYFILNPKYNIIKIGVSSDPFERLTAFKSIYGSKLTLLGFVEGGYSYEKELHSRFKRHMVPLGDFGVNETEWFLFEGQVKTYVEQDLSHNGLALNTIDKKINMKLKTSTYDKLTAFKTGNDSYSDVIERLISLSERLLKENNSQKERIIELEKGK
jgi:predicted CopG family antitoxin